MDLHGEELVIRAKTIAREHRLPLMVHIGDGGATGLARQERAGELTRFLLRHLDAGDILTHLCTPHAGGVLDAARRPVAELNEARARGVVLDSALGRGNFGYEVARQQAHLHVFPDTISSDLTAAGQAFHSLVECMAKFMAIGYTLGDVIRMTTADAAMAIGMGGTLGAIAVGREADLTVLDVVTGEFRFLDATQAVFRGGYGIAPVLTVRGGVLFSPDWGTHPWGWLPAEDEE